MAAFVRKVASIPASTKFAIGHLLGGAGGVEAIFCILAIRYLARSRQERLPRRNLVIGRTYKPWHGQSHEAASPFQWTLSSLAFGL